MGSELYIVLKGPYINQIVRQINGFYFTEDGIIVSGDSMSVKKLHSEPVKEEGILDTDNFKQNFQQQVGKFGNEKLRPSQEFIYNNLKYVFDLLYSEYSEENLIHYTYEIHDLIEKHKVNKRNVKKMMITWMIFHILNSKISVPDLFYELNWNNTDQIVDLFIGLEFISGKKSLIIKNINNYLKLFKPEKKIEKENSIIQKMIKENEKWKKQITLFPKKDFSKNRNPIIRKLYAEYLKSKS